MRVEGEKKGEEYAHTHKVPSKHTNFFLVSALCVMESGQCLVQNFPVNGELKGGCRNYSFHCSFMFFFKVFTFLVMFPKFLMRMVKIFPNSSTRESIGKYFVIWQGVQL
jgi:hypothetical protein